MGMHQNTIVQHHAPVVKHSLLPPLPYCKLILARSALSQHLIENYADYDGRYPSLVWCLSE